MIPDPSSPNSPHSLFRLAEACLRERECSTARPHGDVRAYTYSEALVVMVAFAEWLQLDQQPLKARLAQLAQEQAERDEDYKAVFAEMVERGKKLEAAEAALGETRQALHQLIEKLAVVLPIVDGYIAITHIRSGGQYTGPNLIEEMKHAKALLSRVARTGVPREDSVPQGRTE